MEKIESLENIKRVWEDNSLSLMNKINVISNEFYASGLDLNATASYINATPSELDALLELSALNEEVINKISLVNPPKITWTFLANANENEIEEALKAIKNSKNSEYFLSEKVYKSMISISGPPTEQKINRLTAPEVKKIRMKAENYKRLNDKEINFLKRVASIKVKGSSLSEKQNNWFLQILNNLVDAGVISRNSKDNDQALCDKVLDCLDR